ncbi:MAG: GDSL-type esterase/lipase family protein [Fibrobacteraceae bacterium]
MKFFFAMLSLAVFAAISSSDTTAVTIHVIGDSTVCTYASSAYPQTGWGQELAVFFDTSKVKVNNVAIGGRSSKTFYTDGRLASLKSSVKAGDFIFIQFGHNDRYFGTNARQVPVDSFAYYLQIYIDSAKSWGATPVLVSPMVMNAWKGATLRNIFTEQDYRGVMKTLADKDGIPFLDLNMKSWNQYSSYGQAYITRFLFKFFLAGEYPNYTADTTNDATTHFQEAGSVGHVKMLTEEMDGKSALTALTSALKTMHTLTVSANISTTGLITKSEDLPEGVPVTVRVIPGSGETFKFWVDGNCNEVSEAQIYYGSKMPDAATTYTAIFANGSACVTTSGTSVPIASIVWAQSSSSVAGSSSSAIESSSAKAASWTGFASIIDMANPDSGKGWTETNHTGYTGAGFYNIANEMGSAAYYSFVSTQSASDASIAIRYSNGDAVSRPMTISSDGFSYTFEFPSTGSWDAWDTAYATGVWLDAVPFSFVIQSTSSDGGPNIDFVAFSVAGVSRALKETELLQKPPVEGFALNLSQSLVNVPQAGLCTFRVFDALGHQVFMETHPIAAGSSILNFRAKALQAGSYFAELLFNGKIVLYKSWNIQR